MTRLTPSLGPAVSKPIPIRTKDKTSSAAPAVQTPPRSPKVHFSDTSSIVSGVSRPLTSEEAWLLYDFETHCRECPYCVSPYRKAQAGYPLCHKGEHMSRQISECMYMQKGNVFERYTRHKKPMRVEIPHTYTYLQEQLLVMEEAACRRHIQRQEERPRVRVHNDSNRRIDEPHRSSSTEVVIEGGSRDDHRRKDKYRFEEPREKRYHDREREHKQSLRQHRSEYRYEEKRDRERRRPTEVQPEINVREKKYRTQERRPAWADEDVRARR